MTNKARAPATDELQAALVLLLRGHHGAYQPVTHIERRPSAYSSSFALEEVDVLLEDGAHLPLMFKDLGHQGMLDSARRAKPCFLYDPMREIETYGQLLGPPRLGTAECFGAVVDAARDRYWLFLERVPGVELGQVGALSTWQRVAAWLASMHAELSRRAEAQDCKSSSRLLRYDAEFYLRWLRRLRAVGQSSGRTDLLWLAERYERLIDRLVALPACLIHGEFYASNILVHEVGECLRVCPLDWEMTAVGPRAIDIAALIAGEWSEQDKTALALAYGRALVPGGHSLPAEDAFVEEVNCCRFHLAMQWLAWSRSWTPPIEHAYDWLGEALQLAERIG